MSDALTVIMPVKHFHHDYLWKAVGSVIGQSSQAWRLLVVVETADVSSFHALLEPVLEDTRVEIIANRGRKLAGAINTGVMRAATEFVGLLLGDDMWSKDAVQVLHSYRHAYPNVDFFHSSRVVVDGRDHQISPIYRSRERFELGDFKRGSPVKHLLCWRKAKGVAIGGLDESLNSVGPDDYDFPWAMAEGGAVFKAVAECLYYYRNHGDCYRLTTDLPLTVHHREVRRILKKHGVGLWERLRLMARRAPGLGQQCLYTSSIDKWIEERLGRDPRRRWKPVQYR